MVASRRDWYHRDVGTSELEQGGLRRDQRENLESIVKLDEETESIKLLLRPSTSTVMGNH